MTEHERQVTQLLSEGRTVGEIAAQLHVSRATAASLAKSVVEVYGDPRLNRVDEHIAALRSIKIAG
jgi:orotate phosphoribosyltransferase-like protein